MFIDFAFGAAIYKMAERPGIFSTVDLLDPSAAGVLGQVQCVLPSAVLFSAARAPEAVAVRRALP